MKLLATVGTTNGVKIVRKLQRKVVPLVAVGVLAASVGTGIALAHGTAKPIGTGVVVIDTNLAYLGGAAAGTGMVLTSSGQVLTNNHVISGATNIGSSSRRRATATGQESSATTGPPTSPSCSSRALRI
jgi:S1-C subfamily serine protease